MHEVLEKLYKDIKYEKVNPLQELLDFFNSEWERHWTESIMIVRKDYTPENYRKMGERFIVDYYNRYKRSLPRRTRLSGSSSTLKAAS